jgi:DNA-binding HxlR family transcriptional regulator
MGQFGLSGHVRDCPVELVFASVGKRWKARALFTLSRGQRRFSEMRAAMPGISDKVLTTTLREMEADGLVTRTVHATIPPRVDYAITPLGQELWAALAPLRQWGLQHRVG